MKLDRALRPELSYRFGDDGASILVELLMQDPEDYDVEVIVTEDALFSRPTAGENKGRGLHHVSTVRSFVPLSSGEIRASLPLPPDIRLEKSHLVVIVRKRGETEIVGATVSSIVAPETGSIQGLLQLADGSPAGGEILQVCTDSICLPVFTDNSGGFLIRDIDPGIYEIKSGNDEVGHVVELTSENGVFLQINKRGSES